VWGRPGWRCKGDVGIKTCNKSESNSQSVTVSHMTMFLTLQWPFAAIAARLKFTNVGYQYQLTPKNNPAILFFYNQSETSMIWSSYEGL